MVNRWLEKETGDDGCGMVFGDGRRSPTTSLNGSSRAIAVMGYMGCGVCAIVNHIDINKLDNALDDIPLDRSIASTKTQTDVRRRWHSSTNSICNERTPPWWSITPLESNVTIRKIRLEMSGLSKASKAAAELVAVTSAVLDAGNRPLRSREGMSRLKAHRCRCCCRRYRRCCSMMARPRLVLWALVDYYVTARRSYRRAGCERADEVVP